MGVFLWLRVRVCVPGCVDVACFLVSMEGECSGVVTPQDNTACRCHLARVRDRCVGFCWKPMYVNAESMGVWLCFGFCSADLWLMILGGVMNLLLCWCMVCCETQYVLFVFVSSCLSLCQSVFEGVMMTMRRLFLPVFMFVIIHLYVWSWLVTWEWECLMV